MPTLCKRPEPPVFRGCTSRVPKALGDAAHRPDEFLTAKINVVQALSNLLTRLGA